MSRSDPVVYLGSTPQHARSVSLALDLNTGHVLPQIHLWYDNLFETVSERRVNPPARVSKWQSLAGFQKTPKKPQKGVSMAKADIDVGKLDPQPVTPPELPEAPDIPHDPDRDGSISGDQPSVEPLAIDGEVGPLGNPVDATNPTGACWSGQNQTQTQCFIESQQQLQDSVVAYVAAYEALDPLIYKEDWELQLFGLDLIAFALKATSDPDTQYYHKAMKEDDVPQFRTAMTKKVDDHTSKQHQQLVRCNQVPEGVQVLPAVWAMKCKHHIAMCEIYKWKARLNIRGHMQKYGVHFWETYSLVVCWTTIRLCLVLALLGGWSTCPLDFVQVYPQAEVSTDNMFIEIPQGVDFAGRRKDYCLYILQNISGGKDAGCRWSINLDTRLKELGFQQSKIDKCLYYQGRTLFLVYVNDGILMDLDPEEVERAMKDLSSKFEIEDEGTINDYLGVKVEPGKTPGTFYLSQPHLIDSILEDRKLSNHGASKAKSADTPSTFENKLHKDVTSNPFTYPWDYHSVIGKMNFLEKSTCGDLAYSVHQCGWYMANLMKIHV
jgi:Reverse transcriptase (RNA-dependent DNA polymerase)